MTVATSAHIRSNVEALLPEIDTRGAEIAASRRLPSDLVESLKRAGAFRMPMPRSWGGPEMGLREQVEIIELLSRSDPSVGWCVMIGSDAGFYSAFFDDVVGHELWPDVDAVTAGWVFPAGRARPDGDGYLVEGRWAFGSGITHADVVIGGCLVLDEAGAPALRPDGTPVGRVIVAPASCFEIIDTWHTTGLAGSGSNDYACADLRVPAEHTFSFTDPVRRPGPLYAFPGAFFANMQGVPLGLARRAIDEVRGIARTKLLLPQGVQMRSLARVQDAVADAELKLRSCRSYVYDTLDQLWARLSAGEELTEDDRVDLLLSRVQAFRVGREVAIAMVQLAGTTAIYATSILDRLLRDAVTMGQHAAVGPVAMEAAGQRLLGLTPTGPAATVF